MFGVSRPLLRRRRSPRARAGAVLLATVLLGAVLVAGTAARADSGGLITSFSAAPLGAGSAGGPATFRLALAFSGGGPSGSPQDIALTFAPGVTVAAGAIPVHCDATDLAAAACPAGSRIAHGTAATSLGSAAVWLFAMDPPSPGDLAGVGLVVAPSTSPTEAVPTGPFVTANGALALAPGAVGATPPLTLAVAGIPATVRIAGTDQPLAIRSITVDIAGTLPDQPGMAGGPFVRLPTAGSVDGCRPAVSSVDVVALDRSVSGSASSTFTPVGCAALPYTPSLSATATRTAQGGNARVALDLTQPGLQAATSRFIFGAPVSLLAIRGADRGCGDETLASCGGDVIGRVTVTSPLTTAPLDGLVFATSFNASAHRSAVMIVVPPPIPLRVGGVISEPGNALTVTGLPDLPITDLHIAFTGGAGAPFRARCAVTRGTLLGSLLSAAGAGANADPELALSGCPAGRPPAVIGGPAARSSIAGLERGRPVFTVTIRAGARAPAISLLSLSLPSGLRLDTGTAATGRGIALSTPGRLRTGALRVAARLRRPVREVTVTLAPPALREDRSLKARARGGAARSASVAVGVIDAGGLESDLTVPVATRTGPSPRRHR